jgi:hypothetical protein
VKIRKINAYYWLPPYIPYIKHKRFNYKVLKYVNGKGCLCAPVTFPCLGCFMMGTEEGAHTAPKVPYLFLSPIITIILWPGGLKTTPVRLRTRDWQITVHGLNVSEVQPIFVNKVLLEHSYVHSFCTVLGSFQATTAELPTKAKCLLSCLLQTPLNLIFLSYCLLLILSHLPDLWSLESSRTETLDTLSSLPSPQPSLALSLLRSMLLNTCCS